MIKLDIEPYCHDCPVFDAEQNGIVLYSNNRLESMSDCIISCKHKNVCRRINEHLISKFDEERMREIKVD